MFWAIAPVGIASVGFQSAVVAGGLAFLLRLWPRPPFGALAIVVVTAVAPLAFLHDQARLVLAPIAGAVVAEGVAAFGRRRGWSSSTRLRMVATIVPAVMWAAVVVALVATGGVAWSAHLLGGALVVAATAGALVGLLVTLPAPAQDP